ncbi:MAG: TOBE domain-containing protein, partial [Pseudomonadota bacterium]
GMRLRIDSPSSRSAGPIAIAPEDGAFAELTLEAAGQSFRARSTRLSVADLGLAPGMEVTALVKSVAFDRRLA